VKLGAGRVTILIEAQRTVTPAQAAEAYAIIKSIRYEPAPFGVGFAWISVLRTSAVLMLVSSKSETGSAYARPGLDKSLEVVHLLVDDDASATDRLR